jgi:hypothetical protein
MTDLERSLLMNHETFVARALADVCCDSSLCSFSFFVLGHELPLNLRFCSKDLLKLPRRTAI